MAGRLGQQQTATSAKGRLGKPKPSADLQEYLNPTPSAVVRATPRPAPAFRAPLQTVTDVQGRINARKQPEGVVKKYGKAAFDASAEAGGTAMYELYTDPKGVARELPRAAGQVAKAGGKFALNAPIYMAGGAVGVARTLTEAVLPKLTLGAVSKDELRDSWQRAKPSDEYLFKSEVQPWQQVKEDVDKYTATAPDATPLEKAHLGTTLAFGGFMADAWLNPASGAKKAVTKQLVKEVAKSADEKAIAFAIRTALPQVAEDKALVLARVLKDINDQKRVATILNNTTKKIEAERVAAKKAAKEPTTPSSRPNDVARSPDELRTITNEMVERGELPPEARTPFDTPEIIAARKAADAIPKTHLIETPEREVLRASTIKQMYGTGAAKKERRLDIVMGPPAAGKSSNLVDPLRTKYGSLLADSDEFKKMLPEFQDGKGAMAVHQESAVLNARMLKDTAFPAGDNIVWPTIGDNPERLGRLIDIAKGHGYNVHLHLVDLEPEKAIGRAVSRFEETGRFVDPDYIQNTVGLRPSEIYDLMKGYEGITGYSKYTSDVAKGKPATLLEESGQIRGELVRRPGDHAERIRDGGVKRINRKLEQRAAEASSFDEFFNRLGITKESADATARSKGYADARAFYEAHKTAAAPADAPVDAPPAAAVSEDESWEILAETSGQWEFALRASEREAERIESNLTRVFAEMKGVDLEDLGRGFTQEKLEQAKMQYEWMAERLTDHPGRALVRFISRREGQFLDPKDPKTAKTPKERARIEERNKKLMRAAEAAFEGTEWSDVYDDPDVIRAAIDDFQTQRAELIAIQRRVSEIAHAIRLDKQKDNFVAANQKKLGRQMLEQTKAISDLVAAAERSGFRKGIKEGRQKYDTLVNNLRDRRQKLAALQAAYNLTDSEFAKLRGAKDPRFLTRQEFDSYLAGVEKAAEQFAAKQRERVIIDALISEKDLKKTENLRKALQFPKLEKMSLAQLREFGDILAKTAPGDTFLGPRMIQTAKNTKLGDIKTMAEGRAAVAKQLGIDVTEVSETADADVFFDAFLRDPAWAERDPLRKMIVLDWVTDDVLRANKERLLKDEIEKLAKASRASRRKADAGKQSLRDRILGRLAKTDDMVARYMETPPAGLSALEQRMTPEEIAFGKFGRELMGKYHQYALDDANQRWTLAGVRYSRFADMYLPHMGPKFFERWKNNGLVAAAKTVFKQVQDTQVDFNAYGDRGEVLGYEKFFKNAQKRENLKAAEYSKNVAEVLMSYSNAFERKIQLDAQIPKIKLLEQLLGRKYRTPKTITNPDGVEKVSSDLTRVLNEWVNNKKGQKIEVARIRQGSEVEKYLQVTNMLISLFDLGGNIVTQTASGVGGEVFNVLAYARGAGGTTGYVRGHARALTKQGRKLALENSGVVGEPPWNTLASAFNDAGQTLMSGMFYLFGDLAYRSRRQLFLGMLTPAEFKSGVITPRRLAEIKLELGKVHAMPEFRSVAGGTALVQLANKYTEWATPNFQTSAIILRKMIKDAKQARMKGGTAGLQQFMQSRAARDAAVTAMVGIGAYALGQIVFAPDENDDTPIGKWRQKTAREMGSVIQSATGIGVFGSSRSLDMLEQLQNLVKLLVTMEQYKTSGPGYEKGDYKAVNAAQRMLIPAFVKQFIPTDTGSGKKKDTTGLPPLPPLPKQGVELPELPKLPTLPKL